MLLDLPSTLHQPLKVRPDASKEINRQCWGSGASTRSPTGPTSTLRSSPGGAQSPRLTAPQRENGRPTSGEFSASGRMVGLIKSNAAPRVGKSVHGSARSPTPRPIFPWQPESGKLASPSSPEDRAALAESLLECVYCSSVAASTSFGAVSGRQGFAEKSEASIRETCSPARSSSSATFNPICRGA
jgi:hypothetical protein